MNYCQTKKYTYKLLSYLKRITLHRPRFIIYKMKSLNLIDFYVFLIAIFNFSDFSREKNILKSGVNSRVCYKRLFLWVEYFFHLKA